MRPLLNYKWWQYRNQYSWWFWNDPYSEVRVYSQLKKDAEETETGQTYWFGRPSPKIAEILREEGWTYSQGNPDAFRTDSKSRAENTLGRLNLRLPDWKGEYTYRVYWREPMYYI